MMQENVALPVEAESNVAEPPRGLWLSVLSMVIAAIAIGLASIPVIASDRPLPNPFAEPKPVATFAQIREKHTIMTIATTGFAVTAISWQYVMFGLLIGVAVAVFFNRNVGGRKCWRLSNSKIIAH